MSTNMYSNEPPPPVILPRWPHKGFLVTALVLVVAVGAGGLVGGWVLRGNDQATLANADRPVEVTAKVAAKTPQLDTFEATLEPGEKVVLPSTVPEGATSAVVTSSPRDVGAPVNPGDLVAAVSGRPVFALRVSVPLYRSLAVGDKGVDVRSVNQALSDAGLLRGIVRDTYSNATVAALAKLYARAGFTAPGTPPGSTLSPVDIVDLPEGSVAVSQRAPLNSTVAVGSPVVTLQTAAATVLVRVDSLTRDLLKVGAKAAVSSSSPSEKRTATIASISGFQALDDKAGAPRDKNATTEKFPGYDVGIAIDFGTAGNPWVSDAGLTVTFPLSVPAQPAVPLTAVREAGSAASVQVTKDGVVKKVAITIESQQDGWALIEDTAALRVGDTVVVHQ